jgi:SAM-dependent methyltransferase
LFSESARFYDLIYDQFKDFDAEVDQVAELLKRLAPEARTILDVGCGTGRHAAGLTERHGYQVDGLDLDPAFVEIARGRCPGGQFFIGDMADFRLGKRYDLVLCLFSSIGYVKTKERLAATAGTMGDHLNPGGMAIIEPWFPPDGFFPGKVSYTTVDGEDLKIVRMNTSRVEDGISILDLHYLIGTPEGVQHLQETHELALFTEDEMRVGLEAGGLELVEYDSEGLTGRGLYVVRTSESAP